MIGLIFVKLDVRDQLEDERLQDNDCHWVFKDVMLHYRQHILHNNVQQKQTLSGVTLFIQETAEHFVDESVA
jgi:hypothetical protein